MATLQQLIEAFPTLKGNDRDIAENMIIKSASYGRLTERQETFAEVIIERNKPQAQRPQAPKLELTKLMSMFDNVSLKRPRLTLKVETGERFTISTAGANSRNPGSLYVKVNGEYMGKISPAGIFSPSRDCKVDLAPALNKFCADPVAAATLYGQETGECCFCALELTDERSVKVGYGPVCAKNWGLPWGA